MRDKAGRPHERLRWVLLLGPALVVLHGCATPAPVPASWSEPPAHARPLKAYARDPFVPVNLYVNANRAVPQEHRELVEHLVERLQESNVFTRLEHGAHRWPITLQLQYWTERDASRESAGRRVLSVLMFGLVPIRTETVHYLTAELFIEPDPVAAFGYEVRLENPDSRGRPNGGVRDHAAIETLLERLLHDLSSRRLLPRASSFTTQPERQGEPRTQRPA